MQCAATQCCPAAVGVRAGEGERARAQLDQCPCAGDLSGEGGVAGVAYGKRVGLEIDFAAGGTAA